MVGFVGDQVPVKISDGVVGPEKDVGSIGGIRMKTVLLTGGSGAVGSAIVPELLKDPSLRLILLLRPTRERSVLDRFSDLKKYWAWYGLEDSVWRRVDVLTGDVAQERLGLPLDTYRTLTQDLTHIVHGAAQVKLNMSKEEAHRSSVSTTVHVLRLAEEARSLVKLEYLSTVGVAGTIEGAIPERRITEPRNFHNTYESSKSEAEDLVWAAMDRGLPVTLHRPSMVVGDSRDGRTLHFQVFYHLIEFLSGRATGGWVPDFRNFVWMWCPTITWPVLWRRLSTIPSGRGRSSICPPAVMGLWLWINM